jgi:FKBP-type peptidyl-prolyl cis-trans isomerase SlyD
MQNKPTQITDDVVVSMDYTLKVDGDVFEASPEGEPIEFIQGHGHIIPGLERALYGLEVGDQRTVSVTAEDAYGVIDPEAVLEVPRSEFPEEIPLEPGIQIQVRDEEGQDLDATITSVDAESVQLDFNHPLAGKDLTFDVTVVDIRQATETELAHGHIHSDGHDEPGVDGHS